jgi:UDP-GlcNAc:undecaprenyl-phosphate GlcNAc-1-phosphate transferase
MTPVLATGLLGFVLAIVLTQLCKPLARRTGVVARPKADRWHRTTIPLLGGVGIAGAVLLAIGVPAPSLGRPLLILLAGAAVMFVVGVVDDIRALKPQTKFMLQILSASAMAAFGLQLELTSYPPLNFLLTLFWFVGITNAFNLLDNMDGLAAGIAAITAGFRLMFLLNDGDMAAAQVTAAVVGACLGFLVHNFNPASIFMGDAGSLFLGFLVAGLSLAGTWPYSRSTISVLVFPVLILLVPIFDTSFVTVVRILSGRRVSQGGRDHTSHRLVASGLTERGAVLLLYCVALVCGALAFRGYTSGLSANLVFVAFLGIGLALFGLYLSRVQVYPDVAEGVDERHGFVRFIDNFPYKRHVATVCVDSVLIVAAYYSAYRLRFEHSYAIAEPWFTTSAPIVLVCQLLALSAFRVYQGVWRYTSLPDVIRLFKATTVGTVAAMLTLLILFRFEGYSRAVFIIDWLLLLMLVGGSRISLRVFGELLRSVRADITRVLIYGAGDGGVLAMREIHNNAELNRLAIGFIDDNRWKQRTLVQGLPVLGGLDDVEALVAKHAITEIVVSSARIPQERLEALAATCERLDVRLVRAWLSLDKLVAS